MSSINDLFRAQASLIANNRPSLAAYCMDGGLMTYHAILRVFT